MEMQRQYTKVFVKARWADQWEDAPYLEPLSADLVVAPSIGTAKFRTLYGQGQWEDGSAMLSGANIKNLNQFYVQIAVATNPDFSDMEILWTGFIPVQQFEMLGNRPVETVDAEILAYDLIKLLDRPLEESWVLPVGGSSAEKIDSLVKFNKRYEQEGQVSGNRSQIKYTTDMWEDNESYVFSNEGDVWTNADILEYLLINHQSADGPVFSTWALQEFSPDIWEALGQIKNVYDFEGMSLLEAINALIPKTRGLAWWVQAYLMDPNDVELMVCSLLDEDLTVGEITLPRNKDFVAANIWNAPADSKVAIAVDSRGRADKITVRGAKFKTCFTASFAAGYGLEKAWSDVLETAYKNAAKDVSDYGDLDEDAQAVMNDRYRSSDKFRRVFSSLRLKPDYNWVQGGDFMIPYLNPATGELDLSKNAAYWNVGKRILNWLPFRAGLDYSADAADENPENSEPEYKPIFAVVRDAAGNGYPAEKLGTIDGTISATVRPMRSEMGVEVRFSPAYLAAKNHFSGAEPAIHDLEDEETISCDYEDTEITMFVETDQYVKIEGHSLSNEIKNHIIIDVPSAELWYVVPGTLLDIAADGSDVIYLGHSIIRDDRDLLKSIMAAASAWYSKTRYKINIISERIGGPAEMGEMLIGIDPTGERTETGAVVTHLSYDFQNQKTTTDTDYGELNFAAIATGRRRTPAASTSDGDSVSKKVNILKTEVEKIKEQMGITPQRFEIPATVRGSTTTSAVQLATVITCPAYAIPETDTPEITHYVCRLNTDTTAAYNSATHYITGDACLGSNNRRYVTIEGYTEQSPNEGHDPVTDTDNSHWEISDEIKIEYVKYQHGGNTNTPYSLLNCSPHFRVGDEVAIVSRVVDAETIYYIDETFIHLGLPENASGRWDFDSSQFNSVFK